MKVFLETSALIGLHFRSEEVAATTRASLPAEAAPAVSRYVLFELARGYMASMRELHAETFQCKTRHDLRKLVKSGNRPYTYKGPTWTDALDDHLFTLEQDHDAAETPWVQLLPVMFRSRLRHVIEAGWIACHTAQEVQNPCGCRADLPPPYEDVAGRMQHDLPTALCGAAGNCGVLEYVRAHRGDFVAIHTQQAGVKSRKKAPERKRRVEGIAHLLSANSVILAATPSSPMKPAVMQWPQRTRI